jgi:tRNA nucleotidyltransferase/poly(A) polymerase
MKQSDPKYRKALAIVKLLRKAGHEAYFVGGAVRNHLLGLPAKDYDIATSAKPEETSALFPHCVMVGASFGVVIVIDGEIHTEVATFRSDGEYLDHRRPTSVHYSSMKEDALRRDFTINGLFYDPIGKKVIDYVGGQKDLKAGLLRAVGDATERFKEDALRLLRAVRFASRFDLEIEAKTREAIGKNCSLLSKISPERIRDELTAILTGPHPDRSLLTMSSLGILDVILPEVAAMRGVRQPPEFHPEGDVFEHLLEGFRFIGDSPGAALAFGLLLHDVGKPSTFEDLDRIRFNRHAKVGKEIANAVCRRLRFSNDDRKRIVGLVADHMRFLDVQKMKRAKLRRFLSKPGFEDDLELHRIDCEASHGKLDNYEFCGKALAELAATGEEPGPPPLVTGDDLIVLGLTPGPQFKVLLRKVYDLQLEGVADTRGKALNYLRDLAKDVKT